MRSQAPTRFRDHYAILGVRPDATEAEIKAAYREGAKQCHPDLHPGEAAAERFRLISEARRVLLSPSARAAFNLDRMEHELRVEIVSVVHFRRPRSGTGSAAGPQRAEIARPLWQGGGLILAAILTVLVSLTALPFVAITGGPQSIGVSGFDGGALAGVLNSGACAVLIVLGIATLQGPVGHHRWEALVGFTGAWLLAVTGASFDPHVLVGGFFSSDLTLAIGGRLLPIGIALAVCGAWLLRPVRVTAAGAAGQRAGAAPETA
jgi:DnaJ domain